MYVYMKPQDKSLSMDIMANYSLTSGHEFWKYCSGLGEGVNHFDPI